MTAKLITEIALLVLSFVLSASEVALYSITSTKERPGGKISARMLESPQLLLSTILVSNAISVFLFTLLGASLAVDIGSRISIDTTVALVAEVVVITGILIIFGDAVPKIVATRKPRLMMRLVLPILALLVVVEFPLVYPLNKLLTKVTAARKRSRLSIDSEGLKTLSLVAGRAGVIEEHEAELLRKISYLGEKNVGGMMTPRTQIVSIPTGMKFREVVSTFRTSGHSRIPVFEERDDNVVGILYARDVLPVLKQTKKAGEFAVAAAMRNPVFVPESQSIEKLLDTFRSNRVHIAIVVDEFGGLAGLVTLSDVVREIFGASGEIPRDMAKVIRMRDGSLSVKGSTRLEEIASQLGNLDFEFEPSDTVSSLLIEQHGSVPRVGSRIQKGSFVFEVEQATPKAILQVRLRQLYSTLSDRNG